MPGNAANAIDQGMRMLARGQTVAAAGHFRRVLRRDGHNAGALHGMACVVRACGRDDLAIGLAGRAIEIEGAAHYYVTLALALMARGHLAQARAAVNIAILKAPRDPMACAAQARIAEACGDFATAESACAQAIAAAGGAAWRPRADMARFLWRRDRRDDALSWMREAYRLSPLEDTAMFHELVEMLLGCGHLGEARLSLEAWLRHLPDDALAAGNLGAVLFAQRDFAGALPWLRRCADVMPNADCLNNLGLTLMALGDVEGARQALSMARDMRPGDGRIAVNLATVLSEQGEGRDAAASLCCAVMEDAQADSHTRAQARFNLGTILLAQGRMAEGWVCWEARHALMPAVETHYPVLPCCDRALVADGPPMAEGGTQAERRIVVRAMQGMGDTIQFLRYVPLLARRWRVVLVLPPALHRLARSLRDRTGAPVGSRVEIIAPDDRYPAGVFAQCDLFSLPHLLGLDVLPRPAGAYVGPHEPPRRAGRVRVGLCWSGNAQYRFDRLRSVPAARMALLRDVEGVEFVSLQHGATAGDLPFPMEIPAMDDVMATARVIATLDLVICVDTMVAHLAGAMGWPVWLLNRHGGDWRWSAALDGGGASPYGQRGSCWYPGVRQFRQAECRTPPDSWNDVLMQVRDALRDWRAARDVRS
ncbi:tetratricopeptide repeat protein [Novacetimonas pomaceti]|uniref:tetratricopeptide repeat protein n=1 Tax=Novacetimonas pomaceti TaxID=2021998 RepID=UPI001C2CDF91|nr:tetratricopeptide repeat protein [Novacetimonas pomaceti]MBV1833165.1 tetratricopeptide repeat protein [Novacetimonas pomaceti]